MVRSRTCFRKAASILLSGAMVVAFAPAVATPVAQVTGSDNPTVAYAEDATTQTLPTASDGKITITENGVYQLSSEVTSTILVNSGVTATINLNDHKISVNNGDAIVNKGTLAISGAGSVSAAGTGKAAIANFLDATCTVNGGTYSSTNWYVIKNMGTMTIDGGTVQGTDGNVSSLIDNGWASKTDTVASESVTAQDGKASLTINDGDFVGKSGNSSCSVVKNDDYGTLTINGGTFDSTNNDGTQSGAATPNATTILNWNVATINGGTFKGLYTVSNGSYGADSADKGQLTINGGTFENSSDEGAFGSGNGNKNSDGKVTITGGSFDRAVKKAENGYAIEVTGGTFANDVSSLIPSGSKASTPTATVTASNGTTTYAVGATAVTAAAAAAKDGDTITVTKATDNLNLGTTKATVVNSDSDKSVTVNGNTVAAGKDTKDVTIESLQKQLDDGVKLMGVASPHIATMPESTPAA